MDRPVSFRFRVLGSDGVIEGADYDDTVEGDVGDGYGPLIDGFFAAVDAGQQPGLSLFLDTMILVHALYRAAETGSAVEGAFSGAD